VDTTSKTLLITRKFRVEEITQALAQGGVAKRAVVRHPGAVTLIPMVSTDEVCLIRNFRIAVSQTLIELPAGTLEPNEPPERTADRELIEETGYRARRLTILHDFYLSPGVLDEQMRLYLAEDLEFVGAAREPGEEIENLIVPWSEAMEMVVQGQIRDAKTLVGLLLYDRLRNLRSSSKLG
jgi:ADP-ribose pyrophosphatase